MNKIQNIWLLLLLLSGSSSFAQLHDANWIFGKFDEAFPENTGIGVTQIDFDENPIKMDSLARTLRMSFTNASYSDANGNLIAFSNGSKIFNKNGNVILGTEDLHPDDNFDDGYPYVQGALFLPDPADQNLCYFISADFFVFEANGSPLAGYDSVFFSKIQYDNTEVILLENRNLIAQDTFSNERLLATKHANGRDWWMLLNHHSKNSFLKVLLTPQGFETLDTQEIGDPLFVGLDQGHYSPDGVHLAVYSYSGNTGTVTRSSVDLYNFDRCDGQLSNHQRHIFPSASGAPGGISFSPNSQYMYVSVWDSIVQYDLEAPDIFGSEVTVAKYDGFITPGPDSIQDYTTRFFQMQLAPNDKIYINVPNVGSRYLHVIDQPNEKGVACNVLQHEVLLPYFNFFSMPNFPNYRLGALEDSGCDTLGPICQYSFDADIWSYDFIDQSTNDPTAWTWDFGDGGTSTEQDPTHLFSSTGMYEVCLTTMNEYGEDTYCETIPIIDTDVSEAALSQLISLVPNPTAAQVYFSFPSDYVLERLRLLDASGQLMGIYSGEKMCIDLSSVPSGIYLLEFVDKKGRKVMKRIVRL